MSSVYCKNCVHLTLLSGKPPLPPMCVATCKVLHGPLRDNLEVSGVVAAEKRNRRNNCKHFEKKTNIEAFLKARKLKKLLVQLSGRELVSLSSYSVDLERKGKMSQPKRVRTKKPLKPALLPAPKAAAEAVVESVLEGVGSNGDGKGDETKDYFANLSEEDKQALITEQEPPADRGPAIPLPPREANRSPLDDVSI